MKNELAPLAMLAALAGGAEAAPAGESTLTLGEVRVDSSLRAPPSDRQQRADLGGRAGRRQGGGKERDEQLGAAGADARHPADRDPPGRRIGQGHLPRLQRRGLHQRHQDPDRRRAEQRQQRQPALHRHGLPLDIDYIEVVRGTNDPRYGLHNIGGNINFVTRQGGNYSDGRLTYGSFNTRELQVAWAANRATSRRTTSSPSRTRTAFRDHAKSDKYSLGAKWFFTDDEGLLKVGLVTRLYHHEADEPGFLTRQELKASRTDSAAKNANDGDDRDMKQLALHLTGNCATT